VPSGAQGGLQPMLVSDAEAAQVARWPRLTVTYYEQAADRLGGNRACLSVARRLHRRAYHTLSELGEEALQPA
jgi:transposase